MNIYTVKIRFLTPVFIGSGYDVDAISFVVNRENNKTYLFSIDIARWLKDNLLDDNVKSVLSNFDYLNLRKTIVDSSDILRYSLYKIEIATSKLSSIYQEVINGKKEENQLIVELFPRNNTNFLPYIPGSSLKGSIRTAIGNYFYKRIESIAEKKCHKKEREKQKCYPTYNRFIFGSPIFDVFKYLKISDCILPEDATCIVEPKEVYKNKKTPTPKNFVEATRCILDGYLKEFKTKLIIGDFRDLTYKPKPKEPKLNRTLKKFELKDLILMLNKFYYSRFEYELNFYSSPQMYHIKEIMTNLKNKIDNELQNGNSALIRVGHFSHIECITWDNRRPMAKKWGTTRTLANGRYPFGWVLLSFEEGYEHSEEEYSKEKSTGKLVNEKDDIADFALNEDEEISEIEKICMRLKNNKDEQYSMEVYAKLDSFSKEEQKQIALALKELWMSIPKKWGKKVSKKQKEKIGKIKKILGES